MFHAQVIIKNLFLSPVTLNIGEQIVVTLNPGPHDSYWGTFLGVKGDYLYIKLGNNETEVGFHLSDIAGIDYTSTVTRVTYVVLAEETEVCTRCGAEVGSDNFHWDGCPNKNV